MIRRGGRPIRNFDALLLFKPEQCRTPKSICYAPRFSACATQRLARAVRGDWAERKAALFRIWFDLRRLGEKARPSVQNFLIEVAHLDAAFDPARLHHVAGENGLTALNDVQSPAGSSGI